MVVSSVRVLAIETSCDETAAAVVDNGRVVRSSVVASQADLHARYGGVVPEIASRAHVELICDVIEQSLVEAGASLEEVDAVAAVRGPGLAGALLVGVSAAKAISIARGLPYVGVHHHEAHLYAAMIEDPELEPPLVTLIVSGGHTLLIAMEDHGRYRVLGETVDDAAGEAFDKVARFLGLGYPGGPAIDRVALDGDPEAIRFPRPMRGEGHDFSFSGLKTAVVQYVRKHPDADVADVAASFQAAAVDVLVEKLVGAAQETGISTVVAGGGVAANSALRERLLDLAVGGDLRVVVPSIALCTDNAAMVGAVAAYRLAADGPTPLEAPVVPNLRLA
ncbi:MAG: tRNA N6-adenosine threonylcarbamoyltransferase [Actinomycetota bacterium]|jgi:N6-L-threonylcarbamoyladenine synthase|nr:tRNA N6-adenosine threonylcarbamoyltransferase [Actinomycetota bacterium]